MPTAKELLQRLQESIAQTIDTEDAVEFMPRVYFAEIKGQFYVEFYGSPFDEPYDAFLQTVCAAEVASCLRSLTIRGTDEGANGTRNWDLIRIVESNAIFPHLHTVFIEPTAPEHHNHSIIARDYDEEGQIAGLLSKTPTLRALTVPSAPDSAFFQAGYCPLNILQVDTGYAHQDFLLNLSRADCFPDLAMLDFGDFNQRYMKDYAGYCTPFAHYDMLFRSDAFRSVRKFILRNSVLSPEQLAELRNLRADLAFYLIQTHGEYLRGS